MPRPSRFDAIRPVTTATAIGMAITPVARLSKPALNIFNHAVATHKHLRPADCVMLTAYAQTAARVLSARGNDRQLEKMGRLLIAYGRALRINAMQAPKPKHQGGIGITFEQLGSDYDGDDDDAGEDEAVDAEAGTRV